MATNTPPSAQPRPSAPEDPQDLCCVFVCQQGDLEIKAMLLAASLRKQLGARVELVAAIPTPAERWGTPARATVEFLDRIGVRQVAIENRIDPSHALFNKVACAGVATRADKLLFLDSDIVCLRAFPKGAFAAPFSAKPADLQTFPLPPDRWDTVYREFGLTVPTRRVRATVSGEIMPPYFNSGVVAFDASLPLQETWEACCLAVVRTAAIHPERHWLDQIGLAVAVHQLRVPFACLDEEFNFPLHLKPMPRPLPFLCHYHFPPVIQREPWLNQVVLELAETTALHDAIAANPHWSFLLSRPRLKAPRVPRKGRLANIVSRLRKERPSARLHEGEQRRGDLVITGLPRSGTSLLCRLLHGLPDCVVINEPLAIFGPLANCHNPWWIATYYQALRRDILHGVPVENKLDQGEVTQDTFPVDERTLYSPEVSRPDFVLGTKNNLAYLPRLKLFKTVMPHAPLVVCVRHPLDSIASWKTTFPHLQAVDLSGFPAHYTHDPFLSDKERTRLQAIADTGSPSVRRALLWWHLTETIKAQEKDLILVKYEDLVDHPAREVSRIMRWFPHSEDALPRLKSTGPRPPSKPEVLDDEDHAAIHDLCRENAAHFGYML